MVFHFVKLFAAKAFILGFATFYGSFALLFLIFKRIYYGKDYLEVRERTLPPACLQDTTWGKHSYVKLKNIKLHYVENGDPTKPLMLFVHGFPEFWFSWHSQLKYFAKTHWVVAIDQRGYGDSDKPKSVSQYSLALLEADIVDIVKALGKRNCILVGHDWGGAVAWSLAANHPEMVSKLIILNCPHPGAMQVKLRSSFTQFLRSWYIFMFQLPWLPEACLHVEDLDIFRKMFLNSKGEPCLSPEYIEAYKYTYSEMDAWTPPLNYYRCILTAQEILQPKAMNTPQVLVPTLIIWGENDVALSKDLPDLCRDFVRDLRIEYVPKANHFVQTDQPDVVNKIIESFV